MPAESDFISGRVGACSPGVAAGGTKTGSLVLVVLPVGGIGQVDLLDQVREFIFQVADMPVGIG
jgi:hypothetical protein